jgi:hypothetical protein
VAASFTSLEGRGPADSPYSARSRILLFMTLYIIWPNVTLSRRQTLFSAYCRRKYAKSPSWQLIDHEVLTYRPGRVINLLGQRIQTTGLVSRYNVPLDPKPVVPCLRSDWYSRSSRQDLDESARHYQLAGINRNVVEESKSQRNFAKPSFAADLLS